MFVNLIQIESIHQHSSQRVAINNNSSTLVIKVLLSLIFALNLFDVKFSNPLLKSTRMTKFVVTRFDI